MPTAQHSLDYRTARLRVADWSGASVEAQRPNLVRLLTPEVLARLPPALHQVATDPTDWVAARGREARVLAILERPETLIGLLLIAGPDPDEAVPTLYLGYLLAQRVWGKGMASEAVAGLIGALRGRGPLRLISGVGAGNPASVRVLLKCGFTLDAERSDPETEIFSRLIG